MGAINYGTSEYITIGLKPYNYDDYMTETEDIDYELMQMDYDTDRENIEYILDKYNLNFFNVSIEFGYYEGFYLNINTDFDFYNWEDKADALKEATQIKNMLIECCGCGLCAVYPGWCTGYENYKDSIESVKAAVSKMKDDIKATKTFLQEQKESA